MVKRIVFVTGSGGRDIWIWRIYKELSKHETILPHFISTSKKNTDLLQSLGVQPTAISEIFPIERTAEPDLDYLQACEQKYDLNIWDMWHVSAVRSKKRQKLDAPTVFSYFQYVFKRTEKIVSEFQPDYYLCYGAAAFHAIIFREVLRKSGVKIIDLRPQVIPNTFSIFKDLTNIDPALTIAYRQIKETGLSKEEKQQAEQFISDFRNNPLKPDCARTFNNSIKNKFKKWSSYALQLLKYRKLPPNLRFVFWLIIQKFYDSIGIFEKPKANEKYLLFPLHFQPESTTLIHGKWYVDQATLIENISKATPISHKIYVKEHPKGYGNRHLSFYRRIKKLPNVRLISPHKNTFNLIKNCSLLATITGTTGWEALLFQKPVITFGNIFYNIFDGVKKVEKIEELPSIIRERLDQKINYNHLVKFVAALLKTCYPGLARYPGSCNNHSLKDENIKLLAAGIRDYINKIEK